jgi:hypothetical protein
LGGRDGSEGGDIVRKGYKCMSSRIGGNHGHKDLERVGGGWLHNHCPRIMALQSNDSQPGKSGFCLVVGDTDLSARWIRPLAASDKIHDDLHPFPQTAASARRRLTRLPISHLPLSPRAT